MKGYAKVAFAGAIHEARAHADGIILQSGQVLSESEVVWLPPVKPSTIVALGINYADHAKELSKELTMTAQDEPLAFLKSPSTLIGHRGITVKPAGVKFMHYECELAVVIGKTATRVKRAQAMDYVGGYTVANDYAIRDFLENWYRPNLFVKNRDTCTPIGPFFINASDIDDPHSLDLKTFVNGKLTQSGNTRDLINDIPALIEYLTSFMTLSPGDMILTGTPDGVIPVNPGDEIVTEVEGIGRLVNTIAEESFSDIRC